MTSVYVFSGTIASVAAAWIISDLVRFRSYEQDAKVMCGLRTCVWLVMLYFAAKTAWRVHLNGDTQAAVPYIDRTMARHPPELDRP